MEGKRDVYAATNKHPDPFLQRTHVSTGILRLGERGVRLMEKQKIRVLVAEDNPVICDILRSLFELTDDLEYCGCAMDGEAALQMVKQLHPDVLLLDIILPRLDGLSVLEQLRAMPSEEKPNVLVVTAVGEDTISTRAMELGASYYMVKPYQFSTLVERIRMVAHADEMPIRHVAGEKDDLTSLITQRVIDLGAPTNLLGYTYLIDAVEILLREQNAYPLSKCVYPVLAERHNTTSACVESSLRKIIARIAQANTAYYRQLLAQRPKTGKPVPSNSAFLTMLAEHIKLEY